MDIGERIWQVIKEKKVSVAWVAQQIPCERTNVYNIIHRKSISVELLVKLSRILDHDFFREISQAMFLPPPSQTGGGGVIQRHASYA